VRTAEPSRAVPHRLRALLSRDLAVDLGTANTVIRARGAGVVCNEPSVIALRVDARGQREIIAVGRSAKEMLGRTPAGVEVIRPVRDGVISDFALTAAMLRHFITAARERRELLRPRIVIAVPLGITVVERRAVREAAESAGGREVHLVDQPLAAAIGADLPITDAAGSMIVDVGAGTTDVAVIALGGLVCSRSVRIGGDRMDEAIVQHLKRRYNLLVGERTAEMVKIAIGSAFAADEELATDVRGRDLVTGLPRTAVVTATDVRDAVAEPLRGILEAVRTTLELTPPELACDLSDRGIVLAGGGALLGNLDLLVREETGLPVTIAEDPLGAVALGASRMLEELDVLQAAGAEV
jgi:rod shape-determining protein MreB and related proteins